MAANYDDYDNQLHEGELLNNSRFEIIKKFGEGGFGDVYKVYDNKNEKEKCALKMIKMLIFTKKDLKETIKEIDFLMKYQYKYIVKYIDHFIYQYRPCIVTEFYKDGDLDQFIIERKQKSKKLDTIDILYWSKQILKGLFFLHENGIIHRDLKPGNIFLNGGSLVIGDLGLAKSINEFKSSKTFTGSINYLSPEIINRENYRFEVDIWSFGCVLYELVEFEKAFKGSNIFEITKTIMESPTPTISDDFLNMILKNCFNRLSHKRATSKELIELIKEANKVDLNKLSKKFSQMNFQENKLNSLDRDIMNLNKACKKIQEGNQSDINTMKINYDALNQLRSIVDINEINAKSEYIELLEKLASYEKNVLINYNQELKLQLEVLDLKKKTHSKNDLKIAETLSNLGLVYFDLGQYNKAVDCHQESLQIKKETLPDNDLSVIDTISDIAYVYSNLDANKGLNILEKSTSIIYSKNSIEYAKLLHTFGDVYWVLKDFNKAKVYYEKALEIKIALLPENHSLIAKTLHGLGNAHFDLGNKIKSKEYDEKALEMKKKTLPANHPSIALSLNNLGWLYKELGKNDKAKDHYTKALYIYRKTLPDNHPSVQRTINNLNALK